MSSHDVTVKPGDPPIIHHMDSVTAYNSAKLGMWLFLATELLLFGGLFAAFAIYRWLYLEEFHAASSHLDWKLGLLNTVVLLLSSYTAAKAVQFARAGDNLRVKNYTLITVACAAVFMVVKTIEYTAKYNHHLFPVFGQDIPAGIAPGNFGPFFSLYFVMTGVHGFHVLVGMALLLWYVWRPACHNRFSPRYYTPVEVTALYWHLVDLIWIYLFPLLYLVG